MSVFPRYKNHAVKAYWGIGRKCEPTANLSTETLQREQCNLVDILNKEPFGKHMHRWKHSNTTALTGTHKPANMTEREFIFLKRGSCDTQKA
jgi:hypothetical protein